VKAVADGLRRLDGVAQVNVDLQANLCAIAPVPDRLLDIAGVPAAVHAAGYRTGRMWLRARGAFAAERGAFTIAGSDVALRVDGDAPPGDVLEGLVELGEAIVVRPGAAPR
jgi:hypothetical protein